MDWELSVVVGKEVLPLIERDAFIASWTQLAQEDTKVTVIQEPPFVITWYKQYQDQFEPIVLLGNDLEGNLVGLMPLARSLQNGTITHAGYREGQYHGWISKPEIDEEFPVACVIAVKNMFKCRVWRWGWLPPGSSVNWLNSKSLSENNIYVKYREQKSPLWDLHDTKKLDELLEDESIQSKINSYQQRGDFHLERVRDKEKTRQLMPMMGSQYDFRQEAVHGTTPFLSDANKTDFYIERQNYPDANHFTVLWADGNPVAFHYGACDRYTVYLGLSLFDPSEVKNSPGSLLLLELLKMLRDEGYRYIDLTPSGDEYKGRYANAYQSVYSPTFYFKRSDKIKADIRERSREIAQKSLTKLSINTESVDRTFSYFLKIKNKPKTMTWKKSFNAFIRSIYEHHIIIYYRRNFTQNEPNEVSYPEVRVQRYEDLLTYTRFGDGLTRRELISRASGRFARGDILYTITQDGVLACYNWMAMGGRHYRIEIIDMTFHSPEGSILLYDTYTDPRFRQRGFAKKILMQMIWDGYKSGATDIYFGFDYYHYNAGWRRWVNNSLGGVPFRAYTYTRFLSFCRKKEEPYEKFIKKTKMNL
jgi:GNAT superfamily N-acetyltransferase